MPLAHGSLAVQDQSGPAEHTAEEFGQRADDLTKLRKYQDFLLTLRQFLANLRQPLKFAAVLGLIAVVASQLRWMVANLLQSHEIRKHNATPLDAVGSLNLVSEFSDRLLVERRLSFAQPAEGVDFRLLRQVGDDVLVGLEPAKYVRLDECTQRRVRIMRTRAHLLYETGK